MKASRTASFEGGFAYLWTLLLVAMLGVGTVIGSEIYRTSMRREQERQLLFIGHEFRAALGSYVNAASAGGKGDYPRTLEDLLKDPRFPGTKRHLRRIYRDPVTGKADWGLVKMGDRIVGIYSLSEADPLKRGNFEPDDVSFKGKGHYKDWRFLYPADMSPTTKPGAGAPHSPMTGG